MPWAIRRVLLASCGICLLLAMLLRHLGAVYGLQPLDFSGTAPESTEFPLPLIHEFGPDHDRWVIDLVYSADRKHAYATLEIYREDPKASRYERNWYLWDAADHSQVRGARGFWGEGRMDWYRDNPDFGAKALQELESGQVTPKNRIKVGSSELDVLSAYALVMNLDADVDPEIYIFNSDQPYRSMHWNDIWLKSASYWVDYRDGRFILERYWSPRSLLFRGDQLRWIAGWLIAAAIPLLLFALMPFAEGWWSTRNGIQLALIVPLISFFLVGAIISSFHGGFITILVGMFTYGPFCIALLIALIQAHGAVLFKRMWRQRLQ